MKQVAIIDNTIDLPHGSEEIQQSLLAALPKEGEELRVRVYRGPEGHLPSSLQGIDGVIFSGSKTRIMDTFPWVTKQMEFVQTLYEEKIPSLGICYGEQLFAKALHGDSFVAPCAQYEFGFFEITCNAQAKKSPVFSKLPESFYTFCYHYDEVAKPPKNFQVLASSKNCAIQAYEIEHAPMWGIQFHPEKNLEECKKSIASIKKSQPSLLVENMEEIDKLYDSTVAQHIFSSYIEQL